MDGKKLKNIIVTAIGLVLCGCGGEGGSAPTPVANPVQPPVQPPVVEEVALERADTIEEFEGFVSQQNGVAKDFDYSQSLYSTVAAQHSVGFILDGFSWYGAGLNTTYGAVIENGNTLTFNIQGDASAPSQFTNTFTLEKRAEGVYASTGDTPEYILVNNPLASNLTEADLIGTYVSFGNNILFENNEFEFEANGTLKTGTKIDISQAIGGGCELGISVSKVESAGNTDHHGNGFRINGNVQNCNNSDDDGFVTGVMYAASNDDDEIIVLYFMMDLVSGDKFSGSLRKN